VSPLLCRLCLIARAAGASELLAQPLPDPDAFAAHLRGPHGLAELPAHFDHELEVSSALGFAAGAALEWGLPRESVDRAALAALSVLLGHAVELPGFDLGNLTVVDLLVVPKVETVGPAVASISGAYVGALRWPLYCFRPGDTWSEDYVAEKLVLSGSTCDGASLALTLAIVLRGTALFRHRCTVHREHVPPAFNDAFPDEVAL